MLRRMCKACATVEPLIYVNRKLTGEVVRKGRVGKTTFTTLKCAKCGHEWTYERTKHK